MPTSLRSKGFPGPSEQRPDLKEAIRAINLLLQGKINCGGTVTLTANAATTTLNDVRIGGSSRVFFTPTTANAKTEGTPAVTAKADGSATLTHTNNAQTDRTYDYIVIG